jgi:NAD(P)H-hydrate epimerase
MPDHRPFFISETGIEVPAVSEEEMRAVDRVAETEFELSVLQMMENAGRNLANLTLQQLPSPESRIVVLAGPGGNGGGGICAVRHLRNHGAEVQLVLSKPIEELRGPAAVQAQIISADGMQIIPDSEVPSLIQSADLIVDALIGYSLRGAPAGRVRNYIELMNEATAPTISLDIPSGMDPTSGSTPGLSVEASAVLTLALPKVGLKKFPGRIHLADIGIPNGVYTRLEIPTPQIFTNTYIVQLMNSNPN